MFVYGDVACSDVIGILGMDHAGVGSVLMPVVSITERLHWKSSKQSRNL